MVKGKIMGQDSMYDCSNLLRMAHAEAVKTRTRTGTETAEMIAFIRHVMHDHTARGEALEAMSKIRADMMERMMKGDG